MSRTVNDVSTPSHLSNVHSILNRLLEGDLCKILFDLDIIFCLVFMQDFIIYGTLILSF